MYVKKKGEKIILTRQKALQLIEKNILEKILSRWELKSCRISIHPQYDGCQNLVYYLTNDDSRFVLRISFREDRKLEQIQAETHFITYLHTNGALVAYPIKSRNDCLVEQVKVGEFTFYCVLFNKAKGFRLPDKNYKYREGVSIDEYFHNFGKALGEMHRLTKNYIPINDKVMRPDLIKNMNTLLIPKYLPKDLNVIKSKFDILIKEAEKLPKNKNSYGLIHADFGDGNFVIDYDNGNITTFDFDDSAYCWFMYDIADAWTKGFGWAMFEDTAEKRKYKMNNWFDKIMNGYATENTLSDTWISKLPFFLKIIEMEWFINEFQSAITNDEDIEYDEELLFKVKCIEKDISYFGFFDKIYNHKNPFCLDKI
ncbi:phosphotransferase [Clostridiaceae bacterium M8S5]|nr:phosphotransferase [Clostridiaceae bacterium M8S5]